MNGPKPKPSKIKVIEGNPGRRPLPEDEPIPYVSNDIPEAPLHLSDRAKEEWLSISEKLHRLGLLTEIDYSALALYCQAYGRWADAEEKIQVEGFIIYTDKGNQIQSPMVSIAHRSMELCHKFLTEFGMTPSSRTRVKVVKKEKKSKFTGLISNDGYNDKRKQG